MGGYQLKRRRRGEVWGSLTFPGSNEKGGAHPQIMQIRRRFDAKQAGLAANVSPVVKGRDSLGEIPGEGGGGSRGVWVISGAVLAAPPALYIIIFPRN